MLKVNLALELVLNRTIKGYQDYQGFLKENKNFTIFSTNINKKVNNN